MSRSIDFKALWQQQPAGNKPDINAVIKKAIDLKRKTKNKLIWANLVLMATAIFVIVIWANLSTRVFTTTAGIILIVCSIVAFVAVSSGLHMGLFKSHPEADTFTYLNELISIQKKQQFIQTKVMSLYFVFLSFGLFLYMMEFEDRMSVLWASITFLCSFGWMAFAYFYLGRRQFKKQQAEMSGAIEKLQAINKQLEASKETE
ncbi:hypothetical protein ACFGVS_15890 [Mucilaginibacter sp. AW1-7]|uniref:hypothetical protein n=1 Tax=Mucilaginibacter sp. AW1-7 TaxID=3349874 RepID=UPI003F737709